MIVEQLAPVAITSRDEFSAQVLDTGRPAVMTGAASGWPATKAWTFRRLAERFGDLKIPVRQSDDEFAVFFGNSKIARARAMMGFGDYVRGIADVTPSGSRPPYAGSLDILGDPALAPRLGGLLAACPFPDWMPRRDSDEYRIWIGALGQRSTIHNDSYHNFNVQILGQKRFLLFSPDQQALLSPKFLHRGLWSSPIDPEAPNLERYPQFARARGYVCELQPGDILFIPRFWWHSARAVTASLNINRWVFGAPSEAPWWHQQPEVRGAIDFGGLRSRLRREHEALDPELRANRRESFEFLDHELARIVSEG